MLLQINVPITAESVTVTESHYGLTKVRRDGTNSIIFKKKTPATIAVTECETDPYHIPLNCSLQFPPYHAA